MADRAAIIPDMPIFGSDGALVGTVHRVSGVRILVNHIGASDADHYIVPLARVAEVTDRVTLDCPAVEARAIDSTDSGGGGRSFIPLALGVGVLGLALVYGVTTMIQRGLPAPPAPSAAPSVAPANAATDASAPVATAAIGPVRPTGPAPADRVTIATYLASDAPAPQRFAIDTGFASGAAALDATGMANVRGIAGVMGEHLNTQIKLAGSDGLALRRAAAIKRVLVALGVAEYRITTGASRVKGRSGSGVDLVILAK